MIRFFSLFVVLSFLVVPVFAQDSEVAVVKEAESADNVEIKEQTDGDHDVRLGLSKDMHAIWPMRQKMENALDTVAEKLPEKERLKFKAAMRKSIDYDVLEKASVDAMADIFSDKELKKMIEFYGSKEGRSVSYKTKDYEQALQPLMVNMMDKALLNAKMGSQSFPEK